MEACRQAKVRKLEVSILINEYIVWFDVTDAYVLDPFNNFTMPFFTDV